MEFLDNLKGMPKWGWWVLGGVGVVMVFAYMRSSQPAAPVKVGQAVIPSGKVSESETAGNMTSIINSLTKQFTDQLGKQNEMISSMQKSNADTLAKTNEQHAKDLFSLNERINGLTSSFTQVSTETTNQLTNIVTQMNRPLNLGLGVGDGSAATQKTYSDNWAKWAADPSAREAERARFTTVINDRVKAGQDIKDQLAHKAKFEAQFGKG